MPELSSDAAVVRSLFDRELVCSALRASGVAAGDDACSLLCSAALAHALSRGELPDLSSLAPLASPAVAALLQHGFSTASSRVEKALTSADGSTTKLLVRLFDGRAVEAVLLRHDSSCGRYGDAPRPGRKRTTLCLSSQVGCAMGCTFCATGSMGLLRSLSAGEIVEQAAHALALSRSPLSRVVFMGQGEPLNAYTSVVAACSLLTAAKRRGGFHLPPSALTVSTVGVLPRMRTLAADLPGVRLALSLHAPSQALRETVVPSAASWPLDKLLAACEAHERCSGQPPLIEYTLLGSVNDSAEAAAGLGALLRGRGWTVNLIPFNPVETAAGHRQPGASAVETFQRALRSDWGVNTTVRRTMGADIAGACGQLVTKDIEDTV